MTTHYSNDYYVGTLAGMGLGGLVCRAVQNQAWADVGSDPALLYGSFILWVLGLVLGWRRAGSTRGSQNAKPRGPGNGI